MQLEYIHHFLIIKEFIQLFHFDHIENHSKILLLIFKLILRTSSIGLISYIHELLIEYFLFQNIEPHQP